MKKYIFLGFIILIVVAAAAVLLLQNKSKNANLTQMTTVVTGSATPNPSTSSGPSAPTSAQTKTYVNQTYQYQIYYPGNWDFVQYQDTKTGGTFFPAGKSGDYQSAIAAISVNPKPANSVSVPFDEYVKTAATQEIQGYQKLNSIKKITAMADIVGYETTWMVAPPPMLGSATAQPAAPSVSLPITYFPLPTDNKATVQITLSDKTKLDQYEKMLPTFVYVN